MPWLKDLGFVRVVPVMMVVFSCLVFLTRRVYEEAFLRRRFGEAYEDHIRNVPRWLVRWPAAEPETSPA